MSNLQELLVSSLLLEDYLNSMYAKAARLKSHVLSPNIVATPALAAVAEKEYGPLKVLGGQVRYVMMAMVGSPCMHCLCTI
jgi:hypothetical protein